jgi:cytochrome oxidase Cu insertion factor (SCO1/SenC/PrrC family)
MRSKTGLIGLLVFALLLAACNPNSSHDSSTTSDTASTVAPAWLSIQVLNVKSNEQITFADYRGKTVMVEGMSVWCSVCFYQETQAGQALAQLNSDDVVYVSLDIDPSGEPSLLADYAVTNQFNWTFAMSNPALMEPLIAQFGRAVTVPDNMPIFFISPTGRVSELYTGGRTASQLIDLIEQWSGA